MTKKVMKVYEMNQEQKQAFFNIRSAGNQLINDIENTIQNSKVGTKLYNQAVGILSNHQYLVDKLYSMGTTEIHKSGKCIFKVGTVRAMLSEINSCGVAWLNECCEYVITSLGY